MSLSIIKQAFTLATKVSRQCSGSWQPYTASVWLKLTGDRLEIMSFPGHINLIGSIKIDPSEVSFPQGDIEIFGKDFAKVSSGIKKKGKITVRREDSDTNEVMFTQGLGVWECAERTHITDRKEQIEALVGRVISKARIVKADVKVVDTGWPGRLSTQSLVKLAKDFYIDSRFWELAQKYGFDGCSISRPDNVAILHCSKPDFDLDLITCPILYKE
jgi:hypothetical protein